MSPQVPPAAERMPLVNADGLPGGMATPAEIRN